MSNELWVFKHEPQSLDEMIVSDEKKKLLQKIIKDLPNVLLAGKPGTGKGTFMNILLRETNCNYLKINASMETGIDSIREKVKKFATAYEVEGQKIVYLNESDRLSYHALDSLKDLQEQVQHITRFFFVSNDENLRNDVDGAIKSRCTYQLNLNDPPGKKILLYCLRILKKEGITIKNKASIINLIKQCYPDIRKIIGTLQSNVHNGVIDDISFSSQSDLYNELFGLMKNQDIDNLRKKLKSNFIHYNELYEFLYTKVIDDPDSVNNPGDFILKTGEYLYKNAIVAIQEVNFMAFFMDLIKKDII